MKMGQITENGINMSYLDIVGIMTGCKDEKKNNSDTNRKSIGHHMACITHDY